MFEMEGKGDTALSRETWLKKETRVWVEKGIVEPAQAQEILDLYQSDNKNRLISALFILGAVLFGAGVILFFASNWHAVPRWIKVGLVLLPLVLFYVGAHRTRERYPILSSTLLLLGCIMYGSGIWLMAQIFHINTHFPGGLLYWLLGVLPVAFLTRENPPLVLAALLTGAWVLAENPASPWMALVAIAVFALLYYLVYSMRSVWALVASLLGSVALVGAVLGFNEAILVLGLLITGQTMIILAGHPVNRAGGFITAYEVTGIVLTGIMLLRLSMGDFAGDLARLRGISWETALLGGAYLVYTALGIWVVVANTHWRNWKDILEKHFALISLNALVLFMLLAPVKPVALTATMAIYMFLWALALVFAGYQGQDRVRFSLGLAAFILYTLVEYFNLFWQMLPKSLFFIAGGLVLLVGGYLMERQRKKIVRAWDGGERLE